MKKLISNYILDVRSKSITFTDYNSIDLSGILSISNLTRNVIVYTNSSGGHVEGNRFFYSGVYPQFKNTDSLQIWYVDNLPEEPINTNGLTNTQLRATPLNVNTGLTQSLTNVQLRASDVKITLDGESVPITGTFWQATQPVSATSLPLPTGASTSAIQTTQQNILNSIDDFASQISVDISNINSVLDGGFVNTKIAAWDGVGFDNIDRVGFSLKVIDDNSGTINSTLTSLNGKVTAVNTGAVVISSAPNLTKGIQGSTGFSTQDLKDSGRVAKRYYAIAAATGTTTTETAITLTASSQDSANSTGTSFIPTSGKTLRITAITFATKGHNIATSQTTTFNLRMNTAGAVTTTSTPILLAIRSATPATANSWDRVYIEIPDGMEILGDGIKQFGVTAAATYTTNDPTWDVAIIGYEY